MNKKTSYRQQAYFLVLNGNTIEENEKRFQTLQSLVEESKIELTEANKSEISQILNEL
jgi:prophage maintenance system killer protein